MKRFRQPMHPTGVRGSVVDKGEIRIEEESSKSKIRYLSIQVSTTNKSVTFIAGSVSGQLHPHSKQRPKPRACRCTCGAPERSQSG